MCRCGWAGRSPPIRKAAASARGGETRMRATHLVDLDVDEIGRVAAFARIEVVPVDRDRALRAARDFVAQHFVVARLGAIFGAPRRVIADDARAAVLRTRIAGNA